MPKYKVTYEYRGKVTVEIEATDETQAEHIGLAEADDDIGTRLELYDVTFREIKP